eukprot:2198975-Rhodomonas_salina.1
MHWVCNVWYCQRSPIIRHARYEMSGADLRHSGTEIGYSATALHAMCGTEIGYGAHVTSHVTYGSSSSQLTTFPPPP